jgi:hypothetical protein
LVLVVIFGCLTSLHSRHARADAGGELTVTPTASPTPTNPSGSCCGESCAGLSFAECQAAAETGACDGWANPRLECGESPGSVFFGGLEVEPPQPRVGDEVTLRFEVEARVFSVEGFELKGASSFLEEGTSSGSTFQATATRAGTASVSLEVAYRNEQACTDECGNTYYSSGSLRTATSPQYEIEIAEPPTPTVTATGTPTPTATPDGNGGDGCQLDRGRGGTLGSLLWLLALALIASLRRLTKIASRAL